MRKIYSMKNLTGGGKHQSIPISSNKKSRFWESAFRHHHHHHHHRLLRRRRRRRVKDRHGFQKNKTALDIHPIVEVRVV